MTVYVISANGGTEKIVYNVASVSRPKTSWQLDMIYSDIPIMIPSTKQLRLEK